MPDLNRRPLVITANGLVTVYLAQHRIKRAKAFVSGKYGRYAAALGPSDQAWARWRNNEASISFYLKDYARAKALYEEVLELWRNIDQQGPHDLSIILLNNIAACEMGLNRPEEAVRVLDRALRICRRQPAKCRDELPMLLLAKAGAQALEDHDIEAEEFYKQALVEIRTNYPENHPLAASALLQYSKALRHWGRRAEAAVLKRQAQTVLARHQPTLSVSVHISELADPR